LLLSCLASMSTALCHLSKIIFPFFLIIAVFHDDFCTIQREFILEKIMDRDRGVYWLCEVWRTETGSAYICEFPSTQSCFQEKSPTDRRKVSIFRTVSPKQGRERRGLRSERKLPGDRR
jgi:hypothetical protein